METYLLWPHSSSQADDPTQYVNKIVPFLQEIAVSMHKSVQLSYLEASSSMTSIFIQLTLNNSKVW